MHGKVPDVCMSDDAACQSSLDVVVVTRPARVAPTGGHRSPAAGQLAGTWPPRSTAPRAPLAVPWCWYVCHCTLTLHYTQHYIIPYSIITSLDLVNTDRQVKLDNIFLSDSCACAFFQYGNTEYLFMYSKIGKKISNIKGAYRRSFSTIHYAS